MKKIENYLHLYLGHNVMVYNLHSIMKLHSVSIDHNRILVSDGSLTRYVMMHEVKLILRPLSSITEEEADSIQEKYFFWSIDFDRDKIKFAINIADRLSKQMDVARYLLSRGFDIFGLIDANLALDATKIEKV